MREFVSIDCADLLVDGVRSPRKILVIPLTYNVTSTLHARGFSSLSWSRHTADVVAASFFLGFRLSFPRGTSMHPVRDTDP